MAYIPSCIIVTLLVIQNSYCQDLSVSSEFVPISDALKFVDGINEMNYKMRQSDIEITRLYSSDIHHQSNQTVLCLDHNTQVIDNVDAWTITDNQQTADNEPIEEEYNSIDLVILQITCYTICYLILWDSFRFIINI